jgi:probable addiction module antidote protein
MGISIENDTAPFDPADYLDTEAAQAEFLSAALEGNDPGHFAEALGVVVRARGVSQVARDAGISRSSLDKSLGGGAAPELGTILRVLQALGIKLTASRVEAIDRAAGA